MPRQGSRIDPERHRRGAWATPPALVTHVLDQTLDPVLRGRPALEGLRVLDPACGDGRFLVAAAVRIARWYGVDEAQAAAGCVGVELDPAAAARARAALGPAATIVEGDALAGAWRQPVDVVVGNPPYLTPLRRRSSGGGRRRDGGPYADAAVGFLQEAMACWARPHGGRVGLVVPTSVLATRDAGAARAAALRAGRLASVWWVGTGAFDDAQVDTSVVTLVRGEHSGAIERWRGLAAEPLAAVSGGDLAARPTWGHLLADAAGIPLVVVPAGSGTLADLATATADFRDQYYGLAGAVADDCDGPPLVGAGLIDAGRCMWGERPVRFQGGRYHAPRVDLGRLEPRLARWAERRLVPKVLVATQTTVIEAAVDEAGDWLPSVPVITVVPRQAADLWRVAAVLTAPPVAALAAAAHLGAGFAGSTLKLSAAQVLALPLPIRPWDGAAAALRGGDVVGCAAAMCDAYEVPRPSVLAWWRAGARV